MIMILPFLLFAETAQIDSLNSLIGKSTGLEKVKVFNTLAGLYFNHDLDKASDCAAKAYSYAIEINDHLVI